MNFKEYDIIFRNLKIVDGTGNPTFYGDIAISDDTIVKVGKVLKKAKEEYDCEGLTAAPGFIDIHNHSDISILTQPFAKNYVFQGVTTLVVGNCGESGAPIAENNTSLFLAENLDRNKCNFETFDEYLGVLENSRKSVNIATLIGHGNICSAVIGMENKKPSKDDLEEMKKLVKEAMESGAFGLSTGLIYDPGVFADREEIIELAKVVAEYDGIYNTHMRNESDLLIESLFESIDIGRRSGARVQISHLKASGKRNFGLAKTALDLMEYYRRFGVEVTCDVYPSTFGNTGLQNCLPPWTREKGKDEFLKILKDSDKRLRIVNELSRPSVEWENILLDAGFDETIVSNSVNLSEYEGKSITEISKLLGIDPYETIFHILLNDPDTFIIVGGMSENDVQYILAHDLSMACSDGLIVEFGKDMPHPRNYMAFTKVLSKYVRDENILSLERAISKMTNLPAWKLGLGDRGIIKPGFKADLAIFDLWKVDTKAKHGEPHHYSEGMEYVVVNGKIVLRDGNVTGEMPGILLRKNCK